jgi:uncharacterized protein YdeI (YjbR/CyaY-like superfamily)
MLRKFTKAMLFGVLGFVVVVLTSSTTVTAEDKKDKKDEKVPTIKEIMQKGHKGTDAYITQLKAAAKDGKWDDAKELAKTLAFFGENLGKNKAPIGAADSWEKLTKKYAESTKAAYKGAEDKDAKAVEKALGMINCGECHTPHRPKK